LALLRYQEGALTLENEEAAKLGRKQLQEGLTYDQVVYLFIEQTDGVVKDTMQIFKHEFDAVEQSRLLKMEEELHYFFLFALDYWWQKDPSYTQEQKRVLEKVLFYHLDIGFSDDAEGRAAWNALQERFIAYGQTTNKLEQKDYSAMLHDFANKLSEYCGVGYLHFATLAPSLFTTALQTVSVFRAKLG
jgi:hypothetical protein